MATKDEKGAAPRRARAGKARLVRTSRVADVEVSYIPCNAVVPNEYNPNRQAETEFILLLKSIRDDGFTDPIMVHEVADEMGRHVIVDGEHRWTARIVQEVLHRKGHDADYDPAEVQEVRDGRAGWAEQLGETLQIPVVFVGMSPEQARVATLRHNRARGGEDSSRAARLVTELAGQEGAAFTADALGMREGDVELIIDSVKFVDPGDPEEEDLDPEVMAELSPEAQADPQNRVLAAQSKRDKDETATRERERQAKRVPPVLLVDDEAREVISVIGYKGYLTRLVALCEWGLKDGCVPLEETNGDEA